MFHDDNLIVFSLRLFSVPLKPKDLKVNKTTRDTITFEWKPPENGVDANYLVKINSTFWSFNKTDVTNTTNYEFNGLKSGSNYTIEVSTVSADNLQSDPVTTKSSTGETLR